MPDRRAASSRGGGPSRSQLSGAGKDALIRGMLQDAGLTEEQVAQVAQAFASIHTVVADRTLIERYRKPSFNPYAFSLMKVYRTSGERGLRERLRGIEESRHLQALAKAQQISLPRALRGDDADASGLKEAIVKGVISRHADWQAAS